MSRQETFRTFTEQKVRLAIDSALHTTCSRDAHKSYAYVDSKGYRDFAQLIKNNLEIK